MMKTLSLLIALMFFVGCSGQKEIFKKGQTIKNRHTYEVAVITDVYDVYDLGDKNPVYELDEQEWWASSQMKHWRVLY